jgi:DNA-binding HxlR family transcriptional regulator
MLPLVARGFDQYCPIANALSIVGERWALLVVRELLKGPRRYTDIAEGLPGIGTKVLATRLRELEEAGIVERRKLPPPAASTVYELTEYGLGLEEVLHAIARWGARSLGLPKREDDLDPEWGLNAFPALFYPERARDVTEAFVVRVDDDVFTVRLVDGRLRVEVGALAEADLGIATDMPTFFELASGELPPGEALAAGRVRIDGDPAALDRFFRIFSFAPRLEPAADEARFAHT